MGKSDYNLVSELKYAATVEVQKMLEILVCLIKSIRNLVYINNVPNQIWVSMSQKKKTTQTESMLFQLSLGMRNK